MTWPIAFFLLLGLCGIALILSARANRKVDEAHDKQVRHMADVIQAYEAERRESFEEVRFLCAKLAHYEREAEAIERAWSGRLN